MRYRTIVADPPWPIRWSGGSRKAGWSSGSTLTHKKRLLPYEVMSIADIAGLPIADVADVDAHLFLWTLDRFVIDGSASLVARSWGFEPLPWMVVWEKANAGLGRIVRPAHELILVARRGEARLSNLGATSVQHWPQVYENGAKVHSAKPPQALDFMRSLSTEGPYLELFARKQAMGWDTWGNECRCDVEMEVGG
jgi:N6-adenosine-specific RNA methylase IME4